MKWTGSYDKCHIDHIDKKRWLFAMYTICLLYTSGKSTAFNGKSGHCGYCHPKGPDEWT